MGQVQATDSQPILPGQWPRRSRRIALDAEVSLRRSGKLTYKVRIHDASPHGCKVEFVDRPVLAERAWIKFDGIAPLEARVCWIEGFVTGVQFATPIHPVVFDGLVARLSRQRAGSRR